MRSFFFVTFPHEIRTEAREKQTEKMIKLLYDLAEYFDNAYVIDLNQYGPIYDEKFKENIICTDIFRRRGIF